MGQRNTCEDGPILVATKPVTHLVSQRDFATGFFDGDLRGSVHLSLIESENPSNWIFNWTVLDSRGGRKYQQTIRESMKKANLRIVANWPDGGGGN